MAGFTAIPNAALQDRRLSWLDKNVLLALSLRSDTNGYCFPAYQKIAEDAGCCKRSAIRSVQKLVELGYVFKKKRGLGDTDEQTSNAYFINFNPEM